MCQSDVLALKKQPDAWNQGSIWESLKKKITTWVFHSTITSSFNRSSAGPQSGYLVDRVMLSSPKLAACCLDLAPVTILKGDQLHRCSSRRLASAWQCMGPFQSPIQKQQWRARIKPLSPDLSSGLMEWTGATQPSEGRRSLMKTASPGSITVEKSFMRMTVCCQVTGMSLSGCTGSE